MKKENSLPVVLLRRPHHNLFLVPNNWQLTLPIVQLGIIIFSLLLLQRRFYKIFRQMLV